MNHIKKLIEVALPLEAINRESAREKSIRHGHPSTLHLWWARRPLAACRAVLFASLVDDPSSHPDEFPTEEAQGAERERLFRIIEDLVKWENSNNEKVLEAARREIRRSCGGNPPPVLDPFCGGGSIPLEAQRLGLEAHASDLNPVAVLITKALIEIPPKFAGRPPVNPGARVDGEPGLRAWRGVQGLAEDVRYYGKWMRDEAEKRIGHLYPKAKIPSASGRGKEREATVIAWLWARTVRCPNPACGAEMPLVRSFWLSTKKGKQAWVEPVVDKKAKTVRFQVRTGDGAPPAAPKTGKGASFMCIVCGQPAPKEETRRQFRAKRDRTRMMAMVAEGERGREYLPPDDEHVRIAETAMPKWRPEGEMNENTPNLVSGRGYGIKRWHELFTLRQLVALTTFSDLVAEARQKVRADALTAGFSDDATRLEEGGTGPTAYADAVATYLAFAVDKVAEGSTALCTWSPLPTKLHVVSSFGRQALPMVWDFAEANPFAESSGNLARMAGLVAKVLERHVVNSSSLGSVAQMDVTTAPMYGPTAISTDPPYYDNIGYADLSDFFYVWLRPILKEVHPWLFPTLQVPKSTELVAAAHRFDGDEGKARSFFEEGLGRAFQRMREEQDTDYPLTVYYAFRQAESGENADGGGSGEAHSSTGWETMLEALLGAGFSIHGTWPVRTERAGGFRNKDQNALASSIVLVCRPRPDDAPKTTRREFIKAMKAELPGAIRNLQKGNIAPVDLAQASIGPGMAIFSRYSQVLEADGTPMRVRMALGLINQALEEILAEQEGDFDPDTRWAVAWFEEAGMSEGPFGRAETLTKAKNTSVDGMVRAGFLKAKAGKVRLLKREELDPEWNPSTDERLTVWEVTQHMILALARSERDAADLLRRIGPRGGDARELAYRLYSICEKKKWAEEALAYNTLVIAWSAIADLAAKSARRGPEQETLL
jgi:putative DNA methylase